MGDRPKSMLLVVVLVVAIVQSLPLSGKLHGAPDDQQGLANGETTNTYHEETPKIDTSSQTQRQTGETYKNEHPSAIKRNDAKVEEVQQQPENVNISIDGSLLSGKYDKSIGTSSEDISDLPEMSHMRYRRSGDNPFQNSHVSKCRHADRHYCLNSGTCLLVAALDIKTCRCKVPYTGVRCEMMDLDYLLAQLNDRMEDADHISIGWHK